MGHPGVAEVPGVLGVFSAVPYVGWVVVLVGAVMSVAADWKALRFGVGVGRLAAIAVPLLAVVIGLGVLVFGEAAISGVGITVESIIHRFIRY